MRNLQLIIILLLAISIGYFIWRVVGGQGLDQVSTNEQKLLSLTDLPPSYCPKTAKVVTSLVAPIGQSGRTVAVTGCRSINLTSFKAAKVYIKLPHALSFAVTPGSKAYAPELGDVNEDGSINAVDETMARDNLFSTDTANLADIDSDGSVSATDLVLVRLHQGVAATAGENGDQINWGKIE